jgi:hypothetical protein
MTCLVPSSVRAPASTSMMAVLPPPLGPTNMMPWRTCSCAAVTWSQSVVTDHAEEEGLQGMFKRPCGQ